jgi:NhaP-type Na+/H+ or K+/H+ antiporter
MWQSWGRLHLVLEGSGMLGAVAGGGVLGELMLRGLGWRACFGATAVLLGEGPTAASACPVGLTLT